MTSKELVLKTIKGENPGQTPLYGWVRINMEEQISNRFGSVENFEDHYRFDLAHVFGGPNPYDTEEINKLKNSGVKITPEMLLDIPLSDPNDESKYIDVTKGLITTVGATVFVTFSQTEYLSA